MVPGKYTFLAEQVSHHPPIAAYHVKGDSGYLRYNTERLGNRFIGTTFVFANIYKEYVELLPHNEKYLFKPPGIGIHNILIGSPYLEPNSNGYVRNCACPNDQYAELVFPRRGWNEDSYY